MTRRLLALAAAAAALTVAAPAQAAIFPVCAVRILHSDAGATSSCRAGYSPQVSGATVFRVLTVEVAAGAVRATVTCGYGAYAHTTSEVLYASPAPQSIMTVEDASQTCRNELVSYAENTTAAAVSTWTYQFIGPVA